MKNFNQLISAIEHVHQQLQSQAANAVNQALTIRNWLIGFHIVEFEQKGKDRATYGANLINQISEASKIEGLSPTNLKLFRQFYLTYPHIGQVLTDQSLNWLFTSNQELIIGQSVTDQFTANDNLQVPSLKIISRLSFTHLVELIKISDPLKRTFYELETIKGTWSVRELKRQINSLYYERSGLSAKPEKLAILVQQSTNPQAPVDIIKNVYAFEFLDLKTKDVVEETDLETALLNHLQEFIIELGYGFCLEARQKRILIGETYYFIDLVFYHRILKCHVLLELKIGAFDHGDIGQLNTYLNYFKQELMEDNDNPPMGILLVAEKDHALVKYATAGMDENLFIQKYLIQLPTKERLEKHIENELRKLQ